jgi:transcriptional regulator with XRE-family HTH domain
MEPNKWFKNQLDKYKDDPDYKTEVLQLDVTEQIIKHLDAKEISRTQLANKLNCSPAYISKLLNGGENLTIRKLVEIAQTLECSIDIAFIPCQYQILRAYVYTPKVIQRTNFDEQIEMPKTYEPYSTVAA